MTARATCATPDDDNDGPAGDNVRRTRTTTDVDSDNDGINDGLDQCPIADMPLARCDTDNDGCPGPT